MFDLATHVLVVDDALMVRKLVIKCLNEMGFQNIQEANDGKKALDLVLYARNPIGLIICDWNMPEMDGVELLKKIRSTAKIAKTPFIMLTSNSQPPQVKEALQAGVSHYMVKPFDEETFRAKLAETYKKLHP